MGKVLLTVCLFVPLVAVVDCGLNEYIIVGRLSAGLLRCGARLFNKFDVKTLARERFDNLSDCFVMNRRNVELVQVDCWQCISCVQVLFRNRCDDHANGGGAIGDRVDQDERAGRLVAVVSIKEEGLGRLNRHAGDLVEVQGRHSAMLHRVDVDFVVDMVNAAARRVSRLLQIIRLLGVVHCFFVHPYQHCRERAAYKRKIVGMYEHLAATYVDLLR